MWKNLTAIILTIILALPLMASAGTKVPAKDITVNSTSFSGNLGPLDTNVQHAMETIDQMTGGGVSAVTAVTADYPMASTGGTTPNLSIDLSAYPRSGTLTLNKWCVYNGSSIDCNQDTPGSGSVNSVTASYPLTSSGGTAPNIDIDLSAYAPLANPHFTGNVGINSSSPRGLLEIGTGATIINGSSPVVLIKGNLGVDGKIYGDGSGLTNIAASSGDHATLSNLAYAASGHTGFQPAGSYLTGVSVSSGLTGNGTVGSPLMVDSATYARRGTLTNTKWCTTDGTSISCTENTPTGTITAVTGSYPVASSGGATPNITVDLSAYPRKGTLTNNKWCNTDGTVINCTQDQPTGTVASVTASFPLASSGGANPNLTIDLSSYAHTSDLSSYVPTSRQISTTYPLGGGGTLNGNLTLTIDTSAYPRAGTLTTGKWCTSPDGATIACTQDTPSGTLTAVTGTWPIASSGGTAPNITIDLSAYPRKGTLTTGKWCTSDGTLINCTENTPTGTIGGSGTSNYVAKWNGGSTTLGNTVVYDTGSNVGINTTAPVAVLQVGTGAASLSVPLASNGVLVKGNLEVDGKLYGDGSGLTNLPSGTVTAVTASYPLASSGGTAPNISIDLSAYAKVGTLTNTKWCSTNGTLVSCTENAPSSATGANPTATIGLTATNGSAATFLRSDGAPALSQSIAPTWTGIHTFNNTTIMGANLGIGTTAPQRSLEVDGGVYVKGANVGIGTVSPIAGLQVGGGASTLSVPHNANSVLVKGNLEVDGKLYGDGSMLVGISGGGGSFTLTTNKIPKAATTTSLGDSAAYSVGNNVGIGTSAPVAGLHIGTGVGSLGATLTSTGALIRGNLEVDGTITGTVNVASDAKRSTYIGTNALKNHNAYDSTAFGYRAQYTAGAGYYNDAIGSYALYSNSTAYYNEAIGYQSLYSSTGGEKNICIGYQCGYTISDGDSNVMAGYNTGYAMTSGSFNVALGEVSLYQNTDGSYNTAVGFGAMSYGSTPDYSVGIGYYALYYSVGQQNVAVGLGSMETMTTGDYNTAVGSHTGRYIDGGTNNVFVGNNAGTYLNNGTDYNITSTYNVYIGNDSRASANNETNAVVIAGTTGLGLGSNTTVLGNSSTTKTVLPGGNLGIGTSAPRQKLEVNGTIRATGYQSSDGTAGATVTTCTSFKNGLCVGGT